VSRYVLSVVYRDGVPRETESFDSLEDALRLRDERSDPRYRLSEHWMVWDSEDQERGYLDWDEEAGL
jgi:hypothetical protein